MSLLSYIFGKGKKNPRTQATEKLAESYGSPEVAAMSDVAKAEAKKQTKTEEPAKRPAEPNMPAESYGAIAAQLLKMKKKEPPKKKP